MNTLAREIINKMQVGRAMLNEEPGGLLMECVAKSTGDYIEIGSYTGGSAIMAAKAMDHAKRPGMVFCIDPFERKNWLEGPDLIFQQFWLNMHNFKVKQRIIAFRQYHPPFPVAIHCHRFSVGLIDGNHLGDAPERDYTELKKRVTEYLLFDNVEIKDVARVVNIAMEEDWEEYNSIEYESMRGEEGKIVKFTVLRRKE